MAANSTSARVTALFLDIGGVMLTNGWDRRSREAAAKKFGLDLTMDQFRTFMYDQSTPYQEMIDLVKALKARYGLKIAVVNNEGRELNEHRIQTFRLGDFVDFFISSCFVHFRKPDADIWKVALDIAQVPKEEVVYIDDRAMFVQIAQGLGLRGIVHNYKDVGKTKAALAAMDLTLD